MSVNLYRVRNLLRYIPYKIIAKISPLTYAKLLGVTINGRVKFYGVPKFSTEPWLISLGDNVHITRDVQFLTHDGGTLLFRDRVPDLEITKPITVGDNVYIGVRTIILPGVNVGNNVIIAAGSVVTKDIPNNCVYGGVPARHIKTIEEYFEKICLESIHLGALAPIEKERELKNYYKIR